MGAHGKEPQAWKVTLIERWDAGNKLDGPSASQRVEVNKHHPNLTGNRSQWVLA